MPTSAIETATRMLQSLPEPVQERAVEHLREYLDEITDELKWDEQFAHTADELADLADVAGDQHQNGRSEPFDHERL